MEATIWELANPGSTNEDQAEQLTHIWRQVRRWLDHDRWTTRLEGNQRLEEFEGLYQVSLSTPPAARVLTKDRTS